jgi:L-ascorbate metabolism protein UlaG (beta-lactamase superfamily)
LSASLPAQDLSLDELARGFAAHPPHLGDNGDRLPFYLALDAWVSRPDAVYWDRNPDTANLPLRDYYRAAIQRALIQAAQTKVSTGASIWKLYSSGFIVKTAAGVIAFDAVEGPFKSNRLSPETAPDFAFQWTPEMRRDFARVVDVAFITHHHYDHASYALAREMGAAGKKVVLPPDLKELWNAEPFAPSLVALREGEHRVGPFTVRIFPGGQAMTQFEGAWTPGPKDPNNNVYLVRSAGSPTFLHNGDNRGREFTHWLQQAVEEGWKPDVWFRIMTWPRDLIDKVEAIVKPLIIPGHEYEMGHKPKYGVNVLRSAYEGVGRTRFTENRFAILTWGERLNIGH